MSEKKPRSILICPKCHRTYKNFIPLTNKDSIAVTWCTRCKIVLARFDYGEKEYDEEHPEEVIQ